RRGASDQREDVYSSPASAEAILIDIIGSQQGGHLVCRGWVMIGSTRPRTIETTVAPTHTAIRTAGSVTKGLPGTASAQHAKATVAATAFHQGQVRTAGRGLFWLARLLR